MTCDGENTDNSEETMLKTKVTEILSRNNEIFGRHRKEKQGIKRKRWGGGEELFTFKYSRVKL